MESKNMQTRLNAYISFQNNAREAMEFYKSIFGGTLTISTFKEYGMSSKPEEDNLVMHAMLEAENGITFMGSDTPAGMPYESGARISMTINGYDKEEIQNYWDKLVEGGVIAQPLAEAPWGDWFGIVADKFGVVWMINIAPAK